MPLPPALPSMWRLCQARLPARAAADARRRSCCRSSRPSPTRCSRCWLMLLGRRRRSTATTGLVLRRRARARRLGALRPGSSASSRTRVQRRFRDRVTIALEAHVARLQATVATIAHQERPEYLDRLVGAARPGVRARPPVHVAVLDRSAGCCGWRHARAAGVGPPGAGCCSPLFAVPTVLTLDLAAGRRARGRGTRRAVQQRLAAPPVHDRHHRAAGQGSAGHRHRRRAWSPTGARRGSAGTRPIAGARWRSAAVARARLGGLRRRLRRRDRVRRGPGSTRRPATCCSCSRPARGCRPYIGATVGEIGFLRGHLDGRLAAGSPGWRTTPPRRGARPTRPAPDRLDRRHPLRRTSSFTYPGTDRAVLDDVDAPPAGRRGGRHRRRERRRQDARW